MGRSGSQGPDRRRARAIRLTLGWRRTGSPGRLVGVREHAAANHARPHRVEVVGADRIVTKKDGGRDRWTSSPVCGTERRVATALSRKGEAGIVSSPAPISQPTVNGIAALTVPHSIRSVPPAGVSSIEMVSCSTGALAFPTFIGARPRSSPDG